MLEQRSVATVMPSGHYDKRKEKGKLIKKIGKSRRKEKIIWYEKWYIKERKKIYIREKMVD